LTGVSVVVIFFLLIWSVLEWQDVSSNLLDYSREPDVPMSE